MLRSLVLALALALGAVAGSASEAGARAVTVRFSHPDATADAVTAFRIYLRQAGQSYGAPAWQGLPAPSAGVYTVQVTAPDGVTAYATGTAINESGESAFSNEITLLPPAPVCGNGKLEPTEQCDDGNAASGDGCSATCKVERVPACGDSILDPGEQCDDGNLTPGDGCRTDCTIERCGDARLDPAEQCDDGNLTPGDGCQADCRLPICSDGILDPGEQCDDGNLDVRDGCDAVCRIELPVCGDGFVDDGEQCDDGNLTPGDGCDAACAIEPEATLLPLFVNVGGPDYRDPAGRRWLADTPFTSDGIVATSPTPEIRKTAADPLYHSRRYGDGAGPPVTFELPVEEPGLYYVQLHFAETTNEAPRARSRVFDVLVEGAIRIKGIDVIREFGRYTAGTRTATVFVADGVITIELLPQSGRPMLSGIEVHRASEAPSVPAPGRPTVKCPRCR